MNLDFSRFEALSFDCYGTLIDWESGILGAMRPILAAHAKTISDDEILALYSELEPKAQEGPHRLYKDVLADVVGRFGERLGFAPTPTEAASLAHSLREWRPFPDTVAALRELKRHFRLYVISNVDDDLFAHSARWLEVPFDGVITAQRAGSYKPSLHNFEAALREIGRPREELLHLAESLFHDIAPARQLGIATVWVNRRGGKKASATRAVEAKPDLVVPDLRTLAERVKVQLG